MATDSTSIRRLNELHPDIRQDAIDAYTLACKITPVGVHPLITEALRSFERSDDLYAQGRTKPGNIVTNAKGGNSMHNYALAIDFVLMVNGKMAWDVNENWMKVVKCFKDKGFTWGGNFRSIKDYPHLEKTKGNTLSQLKFKYANKDFIPGTKFINL